MGALTATAGDTACPPGVLCCSLVGSGFRGVPDGVSGKVLPSSSPPPAHIELIAGHIKSSHMLGYGSTNE